MNKINIKAPCTAVIAVINIAVFLILSFKGMTENADFMLEHGAMYVPYMLEDHQWYRMFTSMFLHFGIEHLLNNMLLLVLLGLNLEIEIGKIKYLIIYFASGMCGNILSVIWDIRSNEYFVSAGASGAIFGICGALLYVAVRNRGRVGNISGVGMVVMIAVSLNYGLTQGVVDNAAHIGGLIAGFILGVLLYWKRKGKRGGFTGSRHSS